MTATGNVSSKAPWKRSACDRCRGQKLRCHRDQNRTTDACHRCIKSGATCVTSMARATGRPPTRRVPLTPPAPIDESDHSLSAEIDLSSLNDSSGVDAGFDMIDLDYDLSLDNFIDSIGMQQSDFTMNGVDDDDDDDDNDGENDNDLLFDATGTTQPSSQTTAPLQNQDQVEHHLCPPSLYQLNGFPIPTTAGPSAPGWPSPSFDMELLLSKLNSELSSQLLAARSMSWDVQVILQLTLGHNIGSGIQINGLKEGEGGGLETLSPQSYSHPLVHVSQLSSELERLLASLRPPVSLSYAETAVQQLQTPPMSFPYPSPSSRVPRLRTTQLLAALSCYIKIISIYNIIFSRVFDYLRMNNPKTSFPSNPPTSCESSASASAPMSLCLGSLPIPPNPILSGIMLVHLTKHQLYQIEQLMGLPEHYRVSPASEPINDGEMSELFESQQGQSLLNAIIQLGKEDRDGSQDIQCIQSLKLKMQQIKDF